MLDFSRRQFALAVWVASLGLGTPGCGTILYPERRGQPKGQLDWGVVMLDGLGLLLFLVPGVIAFAVDFATGAIYLPSGPYDSYDFSVHPTRAPQELTRRRLPREELTSERIAAVVSEHVGRSVRIDLAHCRRVPLRSLDEFWSTTDRLIAEGGIPSATPVVNRAQSQSQ